ncbi:uncharacterized protein LOC118431390 [Branchiostoma floridae]|uniref:Uncharacterized protein LOC118431390 n=1 Tax=Branchiostoma floridae TaxID=7739 RepID=A0A9J7MEC7_BRAFL|nr:uncharacterized protein LOC118431390 [Branchiostoma floridae]
MANPSSDMESFNNMLEDARPTRNCYTDFHSHGAPYVPVDTTPIITAETTSFKSSRFGPGELIPLQPNACVERPDLEDFRISRGRETCFCPDCLPLRRCSSTASGSIYTRTNYLNARTPTFPYQLPPSHVSKAHEPTTHTLAFARNRSYHAGMQPERPVGFRPPQRHFIAFDHSSSPYIHRMGNTDNEYVTAPQPTFVRPGIGPTNPADKLGYGPQIDEEPLDLSASGSSAKFAFFDNSQKCGRSIGTEPLVKRIRLSQTQPAEIDTRMLSSSRDVQRTNVSTCTEGPKLPDLSEQPRGDMLEFRQEWTALPRNALTQMPGPKPQLFANSFVGFSPASPPHVSGPPENVAESAQSSLGEATQMITTAGESHQVGYIRTSWDRSEDNAKTMSVGMAPPCLQPRVCTGSPSVNLQHEQQVLINDSRRHGTATSSTNTAQLQDGQPFREDTSKHTVLIPIGNVIVPVHGIRAFSIAERPMMVQCKSALAPQEERSAECVKLRQYLTSDNGVVGVQTHYQANAYTDLNHDLRPSSINRPSSKVMTESCTKSKGNANQIGRDEIAYQPPLPQHQPEVVNPFATSPDACITSSLPILVSLLTGSVESYPTHPVSSPASLPPNVTAQFVSPDPALQQSNGDDTKPKRRSVSMDVSLNCAGLSENRPEQSNTKCGSDEHDAFANARLPNDCPNKVPLQKRSLGPMASHEQPKSSEGHVNKRNEDGCTWIDQAIEGVVLGALFDRPFSELFDYWMSCQPVFLVTEGH